MPSSKSTFNAKQSDSGRSRRQGGGKSDKSARANNTPITIYLTIYIFRGTPDTYYNRHVLVYLTSPQDRNLHETIHVQREFDGDPWQVDRMHREIDWTMTGSYTNHINAGTVVPLPGDEMMPADIISATTTAGREDDAGWNCQNFLLEGLQSLVHAGFQTQEWYDSVEGELMDALIDGAIA